MFVPLSDKPEPGSHELAVLEFWDREEIFAMVRAKNAEGPRFSFIDGPVTANKTLGVHTAWGRTLKDVFQRYKALPVTTNGIRTDSTARACGSRSVSRRNSA